METMLREELLTTTDFPEYERPPVSEVALAAQFEALPKLSPPVLGLLWVRFREAGYTKLEVHDTRGRSIERFGIQGGRAPQIRFEVWDKPPPIRAWFLNDSGTELIQVQPDRFVFNWRRRSVADEYPRYPSVMERFVSHIGTLVEFLKEEDLGSIQPDQAEVTYVNHIGPESGIQDHADISRVVKSWRNDYTDFDLGEPEDVRFAERFVLPGPDGSPAGRLHVVSEPGFRSADKAPLINLRLTARGAPFGEGIPGVVNFFERGRAAIVIGFTAITTPEMHKVWGRSQ